MNGKFWFEKKGFVSEEQAQLSAVDCKKSDSQQHVPDFKTRLVKRLNRWSYKLGERAVKHNWE